MQPKNTVPAVWFLVGPTAVGKTAVAQHLAERTGAAILSTDAMLVYRGMDIGTAKPTPEERGEVRYFGIDLVDTDQPFSTGAWLAQVRAQLAAAAQAVNPRPVATATEDAKPERTPASSDWIAVGGTGLYVRALVQGLDAPAADPVRRQYWQERLTREGVTVLHRELAARAPQVAASLADPENPRRVIRALEHLDAHGMLPATWRDAPRPQLVGLHLPRPVLHARIAVRVERMFAAGFLDEVAALRARFPAWRVDSHTARQAIGYAEACDLLDNHTTREQAVARIVVRTRQLAKRQETWFRHQADVTWIEIAPDEPVAAIAMRVLAAWRKHGPTPIRLS